MAFRRNFIAIGAYTDALEDDVDDFEVSREDGMVFLTGTVSGDDTEILIRPGLYPGIKAAIEAWEEERK